MLMIKFDARVVVTYVPGGLLLPVLTMTETVFYIYKDF